jgi:putative ABC transport system substrate-binding protein
MDRRAFVSTVAGTLLSVAFPFAHAQPAAKVPRIGVLFTGTPATAAQVSEAFNLGLRERGYVEGKSILVERRFGDAKPERLSDLAAELVRLKVDVIVTSADEAIAAVKRQTQTIPIVMTASTDPVGTGFVSSLAHPGGNVTGFTSIFPELSAKKLELLREVVPGLSRVAIMWNPDIRGALLDYKATEEAARSLRLQLQSVEVSRADDIDRAFSEFTTGRAEALIVAPFTLTLDNRGQIASLAQKNRLPSIYGGRAFVEAGGLMAYGSSLDDRWRRAATFVDKILKGAKPGDLPVERPTKFEFVINVKTAKELGLTLPPSLLRRADEVIQ